MARRRGRAFFPNGESLEPAAHVLEARLAQRHADGGDEPARGALVGAPGVRGAGVLLEPGGDELLIGRRRRQRGHFVAAWEGVIGDDLGHGPCF